MHIFFSGIGGTGIGPLALIAHQAGYEVSGSDKQQSGYIEYLRQHGIEHITIGQGAEDIAAAHARQPIDWLVYSSAVMIENPDSAEFIFAREHGIRMSQRDELLNTILEQKQLQLIAIAGTHGKTTTSAMAVWLFKQLDLPVSYSFGAKTSFSDMGAYEEGSRYFIYEADEFARNFLSFHPEQSIIVGIDYDHPDIYPSLAEYEAAFAEFAQQSQHVVTWSDDVNKLSDTDGPRYTVLRKNDEMINKFSLIGAVNRQNAWQVVTAIHALTNEPLETLIQHMNRFPGLSRRFEQLRPGLYTDYAHTPPKIAGAVQTAHEAAGDSVVVIYEGLHNTRQHFIKEELRTLFDSVKELYIVPSYLAREDKSLELLEPQDLVNLLSDTAKSFAHPAQLDDALKTSIEKQLTAGNLVLCLSAGGGGSLDEWLRQNFAAH